MNGARARAAVLFVLVLPGASAALMLPGHLPLWRPMLALPMVVLPSLLALTRLQRHQGRVAFGLGAGYMTRLRWIWLPQLGPGIGASLILLVLFMVADRLLA